VANKQKVIRCFVCGNEWTANEDEAHALMIKCPHCSINDFSGNFTVKDKEEKVEPSRLFKPRWGSQTDEKSEGGKEADVLVLETETKAPTPVKKEHKSGGHAYGGSVAAQQATAAYVEASRSSEGGGGKVYEYIKDSEKTAPKTSKVIILQKADEKPPPSLTNELTSGCFIVTATYGTEAYSRIEVFYRFRDELLLKSRLGRLFTQVYYRISPYPAAAIRRSKTLKAASRSFLDALAPAIRRLL
jgi:phage FluMu protein Com